MKFRFCTLIFCLFSVILFAQSTADSAQVYSRKGEKFLPEKGDCALSADASPFLDYTGKLLSGTGSSSPATASLRNYPFTIGGKYFTSQRQAYRMRLRIGISNHTITNSVVDDNNTSLDTVYLKDSKKSSTSDITLSFGREYRRGKTRLMGYYGWEAILGASSGKNIYRYANAYSNTITTPTSSDFLTPTAIGYASAPQASRVITDKNGTGIKIGGRAFAGVEYFVLPKISIGLEFGWSIVYQNINDGQVITESWDAANSGVRSKTIAKSGSRGFGADTDNSGGALMVNFHF